MLNELFTPSIKTWHNRDHYEYQKRIARAVIEGFDQTRKGIAITIPIELPRQSGKTTTIVDVMEFLLTHVFYEYNIPLPIGVFAPQKDQATTDFERLKMQFTDVMVHYGFRTKMFEKYEKGDPTFPEKWNSKTVRIFNKRGQYVGEVYIFPMSKTSKPESKTFWIIFIEEAQDADDTIMLNSVFPMGAATNALRVLIGTAGTKNCYFKEQLDNNPKAIRISLEEVFAQRRAMFEKTGDETHLYYQKFVENEINEHGKDSDYIQRQYFCKWVIGTGQFVTNEMLDALHGHTELVTENRPRKNKREELEPLPCYVGIDTAKHPDSTWVTVIRDHPTKGENYSQLCNWLVLQGENYENQFYIIKDWLSTFENIRAVSIDSTGQGDFMPDMFANHTSYNLYRTKFNPETKDRIYKGLLQVIHNKLTDIPNLPLNSIYRDFRRQLLQLEKEYKGRFLSVHHPDDPKAHDDAPDSWALAEDAKNQYLKNSPRLTIL